MKQSTLDRQARQWEMLKYGLDKATSLIINPVGLLVTGFVVVNYLQNAEMKITKKFNPRTDQTEDITTTFLTDDQANALRGGMLTAMAYQTGLVDTITGLIKK